jgi:vacuolar protein sorting-associated protein 29
VGDYHIPNRAASIPEKFQRMLVPNKMKRVFCTGNVGNKEQLQELQALAPNLHMVKGDFDEDPSLSETKVVTIGQFKIGIIHGHQVVPWGDSSALAMTQRQLDVDILISGHTHRSSVSNFDGKWFINPGSITGAYSAITPDVIPSFILLAVQGNKIVIYVYELKNGEIAVTKSEFTKKE